MTQLLNDFESESGVASIETSMVFLIIFMFIMFTYEILKFQNDMAMIALNESLATERSDLALLKSEPDKLSFDFDEQIKSLGTGNYFNSLKYKPSAVECYSDISKTTAEKCSEKSKIIKFSYEVKRLASSDEICELFGLPVVLIRETIAVNDYYR
ncbi:MULTISPECIES: hypothetical protein [Citrobacter]|nr:MULTISPECIES: hypothetical protein [Citrobacter]EGT5657361.1 hypothetical protein [Citrobacter braakii]MBJ8997158.1 hypothetical protein [Citrobacter braakii]MDM3453732.1 hypothetical protein [Citrobacter sp. Cb028]MDW2597151.1 hypothetical protein [Citrobacter braakii]MDW2660862.1 hypothetical protein [Citrobacter braakii]